MEITVTEIDPSKKSVKITVSQEDISKKYEEKIGELRTNSLIKGFRPGKVPTYIIERKFGKSIIKEMKLSYLVEGYQDAVKEHDLHPLKEPDIKEEDIVLEKDKECVIEFELEVLPEFEIKKYKELEVKRPAVRVTNKEIDGWLKQLQRARGEWTTEENATSEENDQIACDVNLKVDDEMVWGKENFMLEVADFEMMGTEITKKSFTGKKVGDVVKKNITLPEDFKLTDYQGKKGEISFAITEIKKVKLPELDDKFAEELGAKDLETLKNDLKKNVKEEKETSAQYTIERELIKKLIEETEIQLPEQFIQSRIDQTTEATKARMKREGKSDAKIKTHIDKNEEKTKEEVIKQMKEFLIIEKISQIEKIEVTDHELDHEIEHIAERERRLPGDVKEDYEQRGILDELKYQMKAQKVFAFLRENAKME